MTKRERVLAALRRKPVDRPPVSFWRHVPGGRPHRPRARGGHAGLPAALGPRLHQGHVERRVLRGGLGVRGRLPGLAQRGQAVHASTRCRAGPTGRGSARSTRARGRSAASSRRVRLIARGRADDAPILHTLFSPLTVARKLAGDRLVEDLRRGARRRSSPRSTPSPRPWPATRAPRSRPARTGSSSPPRPPRRTW